MYVCLSVMHMYMYVCSAPDDYLPLNIFLLFLPGTQYVSIPLHVFEDLVVEAELEWFTLSLDTLIVPADRIFLTQPNTTVFIEDKNSGYYMHNCCLMWCFVAHIIYKCWIQSLI